MITFLNGHSVSGKGPGSACAGLAKTRPANPTLMMLAVTPADVMIGFMQQSTHARRL